MTNKYELTDEVILHEGRTIRRIRALRDFGVVKAGEVGGYIESEQNLSHMGDCWIWQSSKVFDRAVISGNAEVFGGAVVFDDAQVCDEVRVFKNATVHGFATLCGDRRVEGADTVIFVKNPPKETKSKVTSASKETKAEVEKVKDEANG